MLLLLQGTPDTTTYMIGGYIVIFGVMGLYLLSLIIRRRNLKNDMELIESLEQKEEI